MTVKRRKAGRSGMEPGEDQLWISDEQRRQRERERERERKQRRRRRNEHN